MVEAKPSCITNVILRTWTDSIRSFALIDINTGVVDTNISDLAQTSSLSGPVGDTISHRHEIFLAQDTSVRGALCRVWYGHGVLSTVWGGV